MKNASFKPGNIFIFNNSPYARIIRLLISAILTILCGIIKVPAFLSIIILLMAIVLSGYEIVLKALDEIEAHNYFATPVILVVVVVLSFVIGFRFDAVLAVILHQIGSIGFEYAIKKTEEQTYGYLKFLGDDTFEDAEHSIEQLTGNTKTANEIRVAADRTLKCSMGFAVLFAILTPIITSISVADSIHRALIILCVSIPSSVAASFPISQKIAAASFAKLGAVVQNESVFEQLGGIEQVVVDKNGVFTPAEPKIISINCTLLNEQTFLAFASHAVYNSDQSFSRAIVNAYNGGYKLDIVSDVNEYPGRGIEAKIDGKSFIIGTSSFLKDMNIAVPDISTSADSIYIHAAILGRYLGYIQIDNQLTDAGCDLIEALHEDEIRDILIAEENCEELADQLNISKFEQYNDLNDKVNVLESICGLNPEQTAFVYNEGIQKHSAAITDIRVGKHSRYADVLIQADSLKSITELKRAANRFSRIVFENAVAVFSVKALLIFLSIIGVSAIWFSVLVESAVVIGSVLNSIRIISK